MKTGMLAAESMFQALQAAGDPPAVLSEYEDRVRSSWVYEELERARNFGPAQKKFGVFLGSGFAWLDQNIFGGRLPFTLHSREPDHGRGYGHLAQ